jgi:hypothetical protein
LGPISLSLRRTTPLRPSEPATPSPPQGNGPVDRGGRGREGMPTPGEGVGSTEAHRESKKIGEISAASTAVSRGLLELGGGRSHRRPRSEAVPRQPDGRLERSSPWTKGVSPLSRLRSVFGPRGTWQSGIPRGPRVSFGGGTSCGSLSACGLAGTNGSPRRRLAARPHPRHAQRADDMPRQDRVEVPVRYRLAAWSWSGAGSVLGRSSPRTRFNPCGRR